MKLAYILPGMGYTTARPVLYFAKKLAEQAGYTVKEIVYGPMPAGGGKTQQGREEAYRIARTAAEEQLPLQDMAAAEDVLLISKSLGTLVAADWQKNYGVTARNIFFTPVQSTLQAAGSADAVIMGDNDPWASADEARKAAEKTGFSLCVIPGANHSLETGKCLADIQILHRVIAAAAEMMR